MLTDAGMDEARLSHIWKTAQSVVAGSVARSGAFLGLDADFNWLKVANLKKEAFQGFQEGPDWPALFGNQSY